MSCGLEQCLAAIVMNFKNKLQDSLSLIQFVMQRTNHTGNLRLIDATIKIRLHQSSKVLSGGQKCVDEGEDMRLKTLCAILI